MKKNEWLAAVITRAFPGFEGFIEKHGHKPGDDFELTRRYNSMASKFNLDFRFVTDRILAPMPKCDLRRDNYLKMARRLAAEAASAYPNFVKDKKEGVRILEGAAERLDWLVSSCSGQANAPEKAKLQILERTKNLLETNGNGDRLSTQSVNGPGA